MAGRKTRTKIRYQADKLLKGFDRQFEHLRYLDEVNAGQSEYINQQLPMLVEAFESLRKAVEAFREGL